MLRYLEENPRMKWSADNSSHDITDLATVAHVLAYFPELATNIAKAAVSRDDLVVVRYVMCNYAVKRDVIMTSSIKHRSVRVHRYLMKMMTADERSNYPVGK